MNISMFEFLNLNKVIPQPMDTLRDMSVGGIRLDKVPYYMLGNPIAPIYQMVKLGMSSIWKEVSKECL